MKLLESKKFEIPKVFLVWDKEELKTLPIGIPFIFAEKHLESKLIRLLEFEVLYKSAIRTGFPFNFKKLLKESGYKDMQSFWMVHTVAQDYTTDSIDSTDSTIDLNSFPSYTLSDFVKDNSCIVNIDKLKELNVFPVWFDTIEKSIKTNIHNFAIYNPNMYNKKLEGMYGALEFTSPDRNLIIIDISGSIPKAVSSTVLIFAKNLAESFYADLLITGSKSTLYDYSELYKLDVENIYIENDMGNDQVYFKELVSSIDKNYKTAIVFGDNHSPCQAWRNKYNKRTKEISKEDGKKLCKWNIDKLISFHTTSNKEIAGYADWFDAKEIENIKDWVVYLA